VTRGLRVAVLVAGLAVAAAATWGLLAGRHPQVHAVTELHVACGLSFLLVGSLAQSRRPHSRTGSLMTVVALLWFAGDLRMVPGPVAQAVAGMAGGLYLAVIGHLVLASPSGRLPRRLDRALIAAVYAGALLGDPGHHVLAAGAQRVIDTVLTLVLLLAIAAHWRAATPPVRRALLPMVWAGGPILAALVLVQTAAIAVSPGRLEAVLAYVTPVALMTLPFSLLAGMVHRNLARIAAGRLVVELGDAPYAGRLREVLARAFHDPSLDVVFWIEARGGYVDREGRGVALPAAGAGCAVTLLERRGRPVAALLHDPSLQDDPALMETVTAAATLAVENERLDAAVKAQLGEVHASRARIVAAADATRRRIERDLHDGAQQRLVNVSLGLRIACDQVRTPAGGALLATLEGTAEQLRLALAELRELAAGIHPAILTEAGLAPALLSIAERSPVPLEVRCGCDQRLPSEVEAAAYFVVSEAVANVSKHARARRVLVTVVRDGGRVRVEIADDGVGGADPQRGSGLGGLADRVAALDGRLEVLSPPQGGTRVVAEIPCG
jgi:signal transduction histidine kinase